MKGERGWQLPERMCYRQFGSSSPIPIDKEEGFVKHENDKPLLGGA
jgi:hypothetical protein